MSITFKMKYMQKFMGNRIYTLICPSCEHPYVFCGIQEKLCTQCSKKFPNIRNLIRLKYKRKNWHGKEDDESKIIIM
jgi:hypothetical protein